MNASRLWSILIGTSLVLPAVAVADDAPATQPVTQAAMTLPATAPATQAAREPKLETAPPGFIRVSAGEFNAFCLPVDEPWVKQTLTSVKIDQLPTTRPGDILGKIAERKDAIAQGLGVDLGIEPAKAAAFLDEQLTPQLTKLDKLHPPVVFLVITEQKLVSLINADWKHPRITYNRLMDQIRFDDRVFFSIDNPMDETLMLANYEPTDAVAARTKKLHDAAAKFGSDTAFSIAARGRVITQVAIAQLVEKEVFVPLKLRDDQSWLQLGVTTYMAAKYAPQLTGADPQQMLADLIYERPDADPKAETIDLLNLPDLSQLLPQYRQPYVNAARRKSMLAIKTLVDKAGPDAIHKAVATVRKNPPKDGSTMVALIAGATDVDLTNELRTKK